MDRVPCGDSLKERVDEGSRARRTEHDQQSEQAKHHNNGDQPPFFVLNNEGEEFFEKRGLSLLVEILKFTLVRRVHGMVCF